MKRANTYHHYIPRCYLKHFANGTGKSTFVHLFDKLENKSYTQSISNICGINDLYSISKESCETFDSEIVNADKVIENEFFSQEVERNYSMILSYTIQSVLSKNCFQKEKKLELAYYIAIQFLRLPDVKKYDSQLAHSLLPQMIELHKQGLFLETGDPKYKDINISYRLDDTINHFKSSYGNNEVVSYFAQRLAQNYWNFIISESNDFYTSDFPVVVNVHDKDATPECMGLTQYGAELSFPVSKSIMLVIWDWRYFSDKKDSDCSIINSTPNLINRYNCLRYLFAKRHLISYANQFDHVRLFYKINGNQHIFNKFQISI